MDLICKIEDPFSVHAAAAEGDYLELESLVVTDAEVNIQDEFGNTPLFYACHSKAKDCVLFLQEKGANHEMKDNNGMTTLQHVCIHGHVEMLELLANKSDVNTQDNDLSTPLHKCALFNRPECAAFLIKKNANTGAVNKIGQTPLHHAAEMGSLECVKILVENGADVNAVVKPPKPEDTSQLLYQTPIQAAILSGKADCIQFLLSKGATITEDQQPFVLHKLARNGSVEAFDFLHPKLIEMNKSKKFDVNQKNQAGHSPLHKASYFGFLNFINRLLDKGADINIVDNEGCSPLHFAAYKNQSEVVSLLLEKGLPIDLRDSKNSTALHKAASSNSTSCVELLIRRGADVNAQDGEGAAPIHKAAFNGHIECINLLIDKGCNLSIKDADGATPLHKAAFNGHAECSMVLIEKGCKLFDKDNSGEQPLDYAKANGATECIKILSDLKESIINKTVELFNSKPPKGIEYAQSERLIDATPAGIANFLFHNEELDKGMVGEYIGGKKAPPDVLMHYLKLFDFSGAEIDVGLRRLVKKFRLAGEAQNISKILEEFSAEFFKQNPNQTTFANADSVFILAFSIIMLNTDAHNVNVKNKMTVEEFVKNNRGINNGQDMAFEFLQGIYERIVNDEIKMQDDDLTEMEDLRKGWLSVFKKHPVRTYWKRFWFVLSDDGSTLRYFKSDSDLEPQGIIPLKSITISSTEKEKRNCIKIVCPEDEKFGSRGNQTNLPPPSTSPTSLAPQNPKKSTADKIPLKTYYLAGDSDIETNRWMKVLTAALKKLAKRK